MGSPFHCALVDDMINDMVDDMINDMVDDMVASLASLGT
jgi:hypothetical protein